MDYIFTNYLELAMIDHVLGTRAFEPPQALYVGLFNASPTETGAVGSEIDTAKGYHRQLCFAWETGTTRAYRRTTCNREDLMFGPATGDWNEVTHWGVFDAITGGNAIAYGQITDINGSWQPRTVSAGQQMPIGVGEIQLAIRQGGITTYLAEAFLDHLVCGGASDATFLYSGGLYTPVPLYAALGTGATTPTAAGTGLTEPVPSSTGYARSELAVGAWSAAALDAITGRGTARNVIPAFFPTFTGSASAHYVGLFSSGAVGSGTLWFYAPLAAPRSITSGQTPIFGAGSLRVIAD